METPREVLDRLIHERGDDYVGLSRMLGRNAAYIQQFIKRGTPKRLAEEDRRRLARYFGIDERLLGAPAAPPPELSELIAVPRLEVGASAGAGSLDSDARPLGRMAFDPLWLRRLGIGDPSRLSMIRVEGDSMTATLSDGDEILVDAGDGADRLRDGIYVLRIEEALVVKRVALSPEGGRISVLSDNPAYPSWPGCDPAGLSVIGRVVWMGRQLR
ncbi:MAG: helix-turn-helix transcriptional regulator [Alphaproteobacteria bacterium]|nr:helix-turn-helix transcriptional regulator [Alphaproteobacteria bacterium]MBV9370762.1 helix-turn-helix transcriptional regulator [Alphaproteobacteria bacterium]MBV9899835.1 helix-turn-helix transcriptional regulator [Alphaproteobacteria bacterium]